MNKLKYLQLLNSLTYMIKFTIVKSLIGLLAGPFLSIMFGKFYRLLWKIITIIKCSNLQD
jgi:hypothetical protein